MVVERCIDDLVQSVSLHIPRQFLFHGYILPFLTLYGCWLYGWFFVYGVEEYYEAGLIGVAVIGLVQILSCLCCHWSVHVQCFLTCKSVSILREMTQFKSYRDAYFFSRLDSLLYCSTCRQLRENLHGSPFLVDIRGTF